MLFRALTEAGASRYLTSPSQGYFGSYRATISGVPKNVPARARPACRSTTPGLTSLSGLKQCSGDVQADIIDEATFTRASGGV